MILYIVILIFEDSYLDGILRFKDADKIKALGHKALFNTPHGNISGAYEFFKSCKEVGIKGCIGMESYYTINHRSLKLPDDLGNSRPNYHMILLALNKNGYKNLVKMSSKAYTEGFYYSPRIDDELLAECNEDIAATSSCLGSRISQLILYNDKEAAKKIIEHHAAIFKDRYFLELQCHAMEDQITVNNILLEFSKELNLPIVMTADSHYLNYEDKALHDKFLCISTNSKIEDTKRFNFGGLDCHLSTAETMEKKRIAYGIPREAFTNTNHIANMVKPDYFLDIVNKYPHYKKVPEGLTADQYLEMLTKQTYSERFGKPSKEVIERVNEELLTIKKMGFSDYILIRYDTIKWAESQGILCGPGRGSSAGSEVCYILGITKIDPMKYGLLFSRMLNEGRIATPKIFSDEE